MVTRSREIAFKHFKCTGLSSFDNRKDRVGAATESLPHRSDSAGEYLQPIEVKKKNLLAEHVLQLTFMMVQ